MSRYFVHVQEVYVKRFSGVNPNSTLKGVVSQHLCTVLLTSWTENRKAIKCGVEKEKKFKFLLQESQMQYIARGPA